MSCVSGCMCVHVRVGECTCMRATSEFTSALAARGIRVAFAFSICSSMPAIKSILKKLPTDFTDAAACNDRQGTRFSLGCCKYSPPKPLD